VLVHGLFGSLGDERILSAFRQAEVHAPDLIGYGEHRSACVEHLSLRDQAALVVDYVKGLGGKVHLVGHSVGGAVAALVCELAPELVASYTSVEGNFTLEDAFWSREIASKSEAEVEEVIERYRADPDRWFANAGVVATEWTSNLARSWLGNQPSTTIRAQARAVVQATGNDEYLSSIRDLLASSMPVYLVAGARSASAWHVPDWANQGCTLRINVPNCGHLLMVEDPTRFAESVITCLNYG
jgi:pimeloyl-ACP methyl ester carboxylesterase